MAFAVAATAYGTNQSTNATSLASSSVATTTGWAALVIYRSGDGSHNAPTDTAGNTYVQIGTQYTNGDFTISMWRCFSLTANASNVVTANFPSNPQYLSVLVAYISGAPGTVDVTVDSTQEAGGVTSITSNAFTTTQADAIAFCVASYSGNNVTMQAGAIAGTTGTLAVTSDGASSGDTGLEYRVLSGIATSATATLGYTTNAYKPACRVVVFAAAIPLTHYDNRIYRLPHGRT
jgi:hypothetical protein